MQKITTDIAIIGAGTAGMAAYAAAKEENSKVILIEKGPLGTTYIRNGGIPSQILREIAQSTSQHTHPQTSITLYGKSIEHKTEFNQILNQLRDQKRDFIDNFVKEIYTIPDDNKIIGNAYFKDRYTLVIPETNTELEAKTFIIATGSEPFIPYDLKKLGERIISSDNLFSLKELPKSLAIFGTGSIGLELGQILTKLGVKTIVFGQKNFWHFTDQKVANDALSAMRENTFIIMNSIITGIEADNDSVKIYYVDDSEHECYLSVDYVLCATGRLPNVNSLKLENAGVIINSNGLPHVNSKTMQTNMPHIFMAGDVAIQNGNLQQAIATGKIAGKNAARYPQMPIEKNNNPQEIIFTNPEMAIVGQNYMEINEAAKHGQKYVIGEALVSKNLFAQMKQQTYGMVHLYFSIEDSRLLGAEICCPEAHSLSHFLDCAILNKMTITELLNSNYYHPSVFELLSVACNDAARKLALYYKNSYIKN